MYEKANNEQRGKLDQVVEALAERRIKRNCDYAMLVKHGEIHVFSYEVWADSIREVFQRFEIPFNHHPYPIST